MSKLYFRYGAMNSGKSALLMQVAHNYEERDMSVFIMKPGVDTKGSDNLISRIGISRKVDHLITKEETLRTELENCAEQKIACVLIDEAQFLTKEQVDELWIFTKKYDTPVICYGLRSDFKTMAFPGSLRLFEVADILEELYTICRCGKRAKFNGRKVFDEFVSSGDQVAIDEVGDVTYEALCGSCYLEKVLKLDLK